MKHLTIAVFLALVCAPLSVAAPALAQDQPKSTTPNVSDVLIGAGLDWLLHHHRRSGCQIRQGGWIEPTQGVWQDDDFFADRAGKELRASSPREYTAELKMVQDRDTLLYGILRPAGQFAADRRDTIAIYGDSTYSKPVSLKMRFTLKQGGTDRILYETPMQYQVNLDGPCQVAPVAFAAMVDASGGVPPAPAPPFQFTQTGPYTIRAELYDANNNATGLFTSVAGTVVKTQGPTVHFVPLYSSKHTHLTVDIATSKSQGVRHLAEAVQKYAPVYFPLPADGLTTVVRGMRDVDPAVARAADTARMFEPHLSFQDATQEVIQAEILSEFWGNAKIAGVGRIVLVAGNEIPGALADGAGGNTHSTKVIFMTADAPFLSVLHEIVHTEYTFLWSGEQMVSLCGFDYHNSTVDSQYFGAVLQKVRGNFGTESAPDIRGVAYGARTQRTEDNPLYLDERAIDSGPYAYPMRADKPLVPKDIFGLTDEPQLRERMRQAYEIMGSQGEVPVVPKKRWTTQCTFFHLLDAFQGPQDPPLILVRAFIAHEGANYRAVFAPVYDEDGTPDLAAGPAGAWSIVLRDAAGSELASYPFTPEWKSAEGRKVHRLISVGFGVPAVEGTQTIELRGPAGAIATLHRSAARPQVTIVSPAEGTAAGARVHLVWKATGEAGKKLLSSVYYSPDEGKTWLDVAFEQKATSLTFRIDSRARSHWVKVVVTDGTRSSDAVVKLKS